MLSQGIERQPGEVEGKVLFDVGAGEPWDRFVSQAVMAQCAGVECLSGIPGSVGGTPVQNVGAYGQEVSETIESVQVLDLQTETTSARVVPRGLRIHLPLQHFQYDRARTVCHSPRRLCAHAWRQPHIGYADLKRDLKAAQTPPNLAETREAVRHIRALKGMLIVEGDPDCRSAGSFFKNPVISQSSMKT